MGPYGTRITRDYDFRKTDFNFNLRTFNFTWLIPK